MLGVEILAWMGLGVMVMDLSRTVPDPCKLFAQGFASAWSAGELPEDAHEKRVRLMRQATDACAEGPSTTIAELVHHGVEAAHAIRFDLNHNAMKVLDLTNPETAAAWRNSGGKISAATKEIGALAKGEGYNVIRFYSECNVPGEEFSGYK